MMNGHTCGTEYIHSKIFWDNMEYEKYEKKGKA